jgi:transketolase
MVKAAAASDGPVYMRMFRKALPDVHGTDYRFEPGKADVLRRGADVTIFASGIMVHEALTAAEILKSEGVDAEIVNIHTIKPLDVEGVIASVDKTGAAVTAENHNVIGGLGSSIAEVLMENRRAPFARIGIRDHFGEVGRMSWLKEKYGMEAKDIASAAKETMGGKTV